MRLCRACSSTCIVNGAHTHIALRIQLVQDGQLAHAKQQSSCHLLLPSELLLQCCPAAGLPGLHSRHLYVLQTVKVCIGALKL